MSATDRQNRLLVAEDWKRIYQSFRNADFQSYDFENLRRVMISYIRENYPEDYNDYIESSEYLALIDLIAFLGQSISFRIDLNARENFLELAERRESVLRLARLLSYNAKRNIAASGLLKFQSVVTTQNVLDSNGKNLSGQVIQWNSTTNTNWYDQFINVINSALATTGQFGNPDDKGIIYGLPTEQYRFQASNLNVPVYSFSKLIDGRNINFEVTSTTFTGKDEIYEEPPAVGNKLSFIYRNDGKGAGSGSNGFFLNFKQGSLNQGTFTVSQPSTNEIVDLDAVNINNSDLWLYRVDNNGLESELWAQVSSVEGNNVIYNSLNKQIKNFYSVVTRTGDRVSLAFSDGTFGNLPEGQFRVYYRVSNGLSYTINPRDIRNIAVEIPYVSNVGQAEVLTVTLALQTSVSNSSPAETNDSIKNNAPATYYTQNRMITGEDYNINPLSVNQTIVKVKAVNRSSSGISRYFDLVDPTGKYSKTNLFSDDGVIYKEEFNNSFRFSYATRTDIQAVIYNEIYALLEKDSLRNFYYSNFSKIDTAPLGITWQEITTDSNQSTGYIGEPTLPYKVGSTTSTDLKYVESGSLIKFTAPLGQYFDQNNSNRLTYGIPSVIGSTTVIWAKIVSVSGDGTSNGTGVLDSGNGPIIVNEKIPDGALVTQIIPIYRNTISDSTVATMVDLIFSNKPFGLRYNNVTKQWVIIFESNLNIVDAFSLGKQGDKTNQKQDQSWLLLFTTDSEFYTVTSRELRYIFESDAQIRFYFDSSDKIYDTRSNTVVKDKIKILSINNKPFVLTPFTYDLDWEISEEFKGLDGYIDTKKIQITFSDTDDDGVIDNPDLFDLIVDPANETADVKDKYIVLEKYTVSQNQEDYRYINNDTEIVKILQSESLVGSFLNYTDGQYFYFVNTNVVKRLNLTNAILVPSLNYKVYVGRDGIKFQYIHNADYETRIDPGLTNLIDVFVLTKEYDTKYRQWLDGTLSTEPLPPSSDNLYNLLSPELNKIKSISDEVIYHPVKYKVLFGTTASADVRATFKVVKNSEQVVSDNDTKTRVLIAINEFFSLENWEFGDKFYFSELAAYVMNSVSPYIVNFIIVPTQANLSFGSLYEIAAEKDQIFISGCTVDNIEIISNISSSNIKSLGNIAAESVILAQQNVSSTGSN